jgi:hypothetical protein
MPWPLVIAGMFFTVGLILIKAPAPMLIAVGMYLPFYATAGIFVGGIFRMLMDKQLERDEASEERKQKAENTGVLISSGLIAGGALTAVVIAFLVLGYNMLGTPMPTDPEYIRMTAELGVKPDEVPTFLDRIRGFVGVAPTAWLGLLAVAGGVWLLTWLPLKASKEQ